MGYLTIARRQKKSEEIPFLNKTQKALIEPPDRTQELRAFFSTIRPEKDLSAQGAKVTKGITVELVK